MERNGSLAHAETILRDMRVVGFLLSRLHLVITSLQTQRDSLPVNEPVILDGVADGKYSRATMSTFSQLLDN
jgi:hypothetical protein